MQLNIVLQSADWVVLVYSISWEEGESLAKLADNCIAPVQGKGLTMSYDM
jgi:hypothetical protein